MSQVDRLAIAKRRLPNILGRLAAASMRTLEQKISDAGPFDQRVDPHILTTARNELRDEGELTSTLRNEVPFYHLRSTPSADVTARLAEIGPIHDRTVDRGLTVRLGQTLEIAIYRALLLREDHTFLGGFVDLEDHDDATLYSKQEPPTLVAGRISSGPVDFLYVHPKAGLAAIEAKNVREWIYPDRGEVTDLLRKAVELDAVPVLIARRIAYGAFSVLNPAGVLIHQMYNQLYPEADADTAALAKDKDLLGYHDIRVGNDPDVRLKKFILEDLPSILPDARVRFDKYKDLLGDFGAGRMPYAEFAGRLRRRERGQLEDGPAEWFLDH